MKNMLVMVSIYKVTCNQNVILHKIPSPTMVAVIGQTSYQKSWTFPSKQSTMIISSFSPQNIQLLLTRKFLHFVFQQKVK